MNIRPVMLLVPSLVALCVLAGCSGSSGDGSSASASSSPTKLSKELQDWSNRNAAKFDGADSAIERAKAALVREGVNGNAERIQALSEAQAAVQDVSRMQQAAAMSFQEGTNLMTRAIKENQRLESEKAQLKKDNEALEKREHYFSVSIIVLVLATATTWAGLIWNAFVNREVRMVTAHEDRELKRQEILKNDLLIEKTRHEIANIAPSAPTVRPKVDTLLAPPSPLGA